MDKEKQIAILVKQDILVKQNEGIEKSLDAKGIQYNKLVLEPSSSEDTLIKLKDYNTYINLYSFEVMPQGITPKKDVDVYSVL
jgi:hypothetical protein